MSSIQENIERGWAEIEGFPFHRVTIDGRIQTKYLRNKFGVVGPDWYDKALSLDRRGYPKVVFSLKNKSHSNSVHRYVAMTFVENNQSKREVNHIDGNKENNHYTNLEWVTSKENVSHAFKNNLRACFKGSKNGISKLKEEQIPYIRNLIDSGMSNAEIGRLYGVRRETIFKIKYKISWTHV